MDPVPPTFGDLLTRVRAGDPGAAEELIRKYEPVIRVTVRARLTDSRLRRVMDTMDICQSVTDTRAIDNFIVRLRKYIEDDPTKPQHLLTVRGVGYRFVVVNRPP